MGRTGTYGCCGGRVTRGMHFCDDLDDDEDDVSTPSSTSNNAASNAFSKASSFTAATDASKVTEQGAAAIDKTKNLMSQYSANDAVESAKASALANADPKAITSAIPDTKSLFNQNMEKLNGQLSSTVPEADKAIEAANSNLTDLAGNLTGQASGALQKPTTFITNLSKESVVPFELPGMSSPFDLGSMSDGLLDRISSFSGLSSITNSSQLTSALSNISSNFSSAISTATSFAGNMNIPGIGNATSLLGNIQNAIPSSISSGLSSMSSLSLDNIVDKVSSYMPDNVKNIANLVSDEYKSLTNNISSVLSSLPGVDGAVDALKGALKSSNSDSVYGNITDALGNQWSGIAEESRYSLTDVRKLQNAAKPICPELPNLDELVDFSKLKSLYDTLLNLAANNGLTDLLDKLLACGESIYSDTRSMTILASQATAAASKGDIATLQTIVNFAGASRIPDPVATIRSTLSNLPNTDSSTMTALRALSSSLGVVFEDITKNETGNYSAPAIFAMIQNDPAPLDYVSDDSSLKYTALAVLDQYSIANPSDVSYMGI
jgi:endonuclease III